VVEIARQLPAASLTLEGEALAVDRDQWFKIKPGETLDLVILTAERGHGAP
jgi:ATP-dependent DNA ligase